MKDNIIQISNKWVLPNFKIADFGHFILHLSRCKRYQFMVLFKQKSRPDSLTASHKQKKDDEMSNGITDSTTVCVVPMFNKICSSEKNKERFISFLNNKFGNKLPSVIESPWKCIYYGERTSDHKGESRFRAPQSRLIWLVRYLCGKKCFIDKLKSYKNPVTIEKRTSLFSGDKSTRDEAIKALKANCPEPWMIFEGGTAPDVCIKTDKYVLVIEGKQTEGKRTTTTKWGMKRDQLIRHMDAFLDDATKPVFGLFIYDGRVSANYNFEEYSSGQAFEESLIHRKDKKLVEKARSGFLGAVTWEELEDIFGVKCLK